MSAAHSVRQTRRALPLIAITIAYVGMVLVLPLAALALRAARLGVHEMAAAFQAADGARVLLTSVLLAVMCIVVNGAAGIATAIVLARHRARGAWLLDALVDVPLVVSPVMVGLGILTVVGRDGWLAPVLDRLDLTIAFALPGVAICTLFVTVPFVAREVAPLLDALGTDEEQAAETLGAGAWQVFRRVTLPNIRDGVRAGVALTSARALGEFGAVLVVGGAITGRTQTATTFIYTALQERRDAAALGMAALLAGMSIALLVALERLRRTVART